VQIAGAIEASTRGEFWWSHRGHRQGLLATLVGSWHWERSVQNDHSDAVPSDRGHRQGGCHRSRAGPTSLVAGTGNACTKEKKAIASSIALVHDLLHHEFMID
jgi:hypothetical protein